MSSISTTFMIFNVSFSFLIFSTLTDFFKLIKGEFKVVSFIFLNIYRVGFKKY